MNPRPYNHRLNDSVALDLPPSPHSELRIPHCVMELAPRKESATTTSVFQIADFRLLLASIACSTVAGQALAMVADYQVYAITKSPLALGFLGLVEAIPAISLALFGGHVADRYERRRILQVTLAILAVACGQLGVQVATSSQRLTLIVLYAAMFIVGIARSFAGPAISALEAQVVPPHLIVKSSTWFASTWLLASIAGPVIGGHAFDALGPALTYVLIAALYLMSWLTVLRLQPRPVAPPAERESVWQSIATGVAYVARDQVLLGSMALDLFAVLFGGCIAILPVFADQILHIGPTELGYLNGATYAGALLTMLIATRHPPVRHAGRNLLVAVAGFGVSMLVFAVSRNFYLSLVALFLSGVCDGVSVVIRRSIVRLLSPNYLRGRIAAVSLIFIGSSNELGALESGLAASWLGTVPSVVAGGTLTLVVVACTSLLAPRLRALRLDQVPAEPS
jgi:MFS family permease